MEYTTHRGWLLALLRTLRTLGVDGDEFLQPEALSIDELLDGTSRLSIAAMTRIWHRAQKITKEPAIGLRVSDQVFATTFAPLSTTLYAVSDLMMGLQIMARYGSIFTDVASFWVRRTADGTDLMAITRQQLADEAVDSGIAGLLKIMRDVSVPDLVPVAVQLGRPMPDDPTPWNRFFGTRVRFKSGAASILRFSDSSLNQRLYGHSAELLETCIGLMDAQLASFRHGPISSFVRAQIILSLQDQAARIEEVSRVLGITPRTLQRRLGEEKQNFSRLVDEIRREFAERYMDRSGLSVTEISQKLGYANPSSFTRAYKRWYGASPMTLRRHDSKSAGPFKSLLDDHDVSKHAEANRKDAHR